MKPQLQTVAIANGCTTYLFGVEGHRETRDTL